MNQERKNITEKKKEKKKRSGPLETFLRTNISNLMEDSRYVGCFFFSGDPFSLSGKSIYYSFFSFLYFIFGVHFPSRVQSWNRDWILRKKNKLSDVNLRKVVLVKKKKIWKNYKKTSGKEENKDVCVGVLLYVCASMCNDKMHEKVSTRCEGKFERIEKVAKE